MPTQIASDLFNRASLGSNWTQVGGTNALLGIKSSTAVAVVSGNGDESSSDFIYWSGSGTFQASQYSQLTISTAGNNSTVNQIGPAVLVQSNGGGGYCLFYYAGGLYITKVGNGGGNPAGPYSHTLVANDVLLITAVPGASSVVLTAFLNGSQILQATDSSNPWLTGTPGIIGASQTNLATQWQGTPWSAGDNTTQTAVTPTFNPVAGTYTSAQAVTITSTQVTAGIAYTTDGTTPTSDGNGNVTHGTALANGGTVTVSSTQTLTAIAYQATYNDSAIEQGQYTINIAPSVYSVIDSRNFGAFPNNPVDINGTETYTGLGTGVTNVTDCRKAGAPVDSRAAGAPVASGTSYPQNCRTQPPFED